MVTETNEDGHWAGTVGAGTVESLLGGDCTVGLPGGECRVSYQEGSVEQAGG